MPFPTQTFAIAAVLIVIAVVSLLFQVSTVIWFARGYRCLVLTGAQIHFIADIQRRPRVPVSSSCALSNDCAEQHALNRTNTSVQAKPVAAQPSKVIADRPHESTEVRSVPPAIGTPTPETTSRSSLRTNASLTPGSKSAAAPAPGALHVPSSESKVLPQPALPASAPGARAGAAGASAEEAGVGTTGLGRP
eukprot:968584-Rhodomonas_salina.2